MIESIAIRPYDLPLRRAWGSARGGFERRHGWLVRVDSGGLSGHGDCAPLPAAGTETPEIAADVLARWRARVRGQRIDTLLDALASETSPAPAATFALECALADLLSRRLGVTLRHWLSPRAANQMEVNAMLGRLDAVTEHHLQRNAKQGFRVLKLKVGLAAPEGELERLIALAQALPPGVTLRLDANGAWDFDTARRMIAGLSTLPIESLEEPLSAPISEHLATLQAMAPFPLALDESLPASVLVLDPARLGVRRLVLKPAALGGLRRTLDLARRAGDAGLDVVVTSLVESAAGLWPTAQLAAAIGATAPQGLATADWLARDLGAAPRPRQGRIMLTDQPGSGFEPRP